MPRHGFRVAVVTIVSCMMLLAGCATDMHVKHMAQKAVQETAQSEQLPANQGSLITATSDAYLAGEAIAAPVQRPAILNRHVTYISPVPVSVATVGAFISRTVGIQVDASGLDSGAMGGDGPSVELYHNGGPLYELLDQMAAKTNSWWKLAQGGVEFYRMETRVFTLAAVPQSKTATSNINTMNAGTGSAGGMGGGAGGAAGGGGSSSSGGGMSSSGLEAKSTISSDTWKEILQNAETVADTAAGGQGGAKVSIDPTAGTLTVTGTPSEIRRVADWVRQYNEVAGQQVEITTRVYKVDLNREDNYGITPNVIWKDAVGVHNWSVTGLSLPSVNTAGTTPASMSASIVSSSSQASDLNGSQLALQALSTLGKVVETFSYSQIAENGYPTVLADGNSISYLYSVSNYTGTVGGQQSTLTPGTINTGLTSMVTPRVIDGNVHLAISISDGSLVSMTTATSGSSSIQTPNVNMIALMEDVHLHPGQALLLSGFQDTNGSSTHNGVGSAYNPVLGGGFDASTKRSLLAIVITAKVL